MRPSLAILSKELPPLNPFHNIPFSSKHISRFVQGWAGEGSYTMLQSMWRLSSLTRSQIRVPALGVHSLNYCMVKKVHIRRFSLYLIILFNLYSLRQWKFCGDRDCVFPSHHCIQRCLVGCLVIILQARILEWVAIPFSKGSFWPQGSNLVLPHCRKILYHLSHQGNPTNIYNRCSVNKVNPPFKDRGRSEVSP